MLASSTLVGGPAAWRGPDMAGRIAEWTRPLRPELAETLLKNLERVCHIPLTGITREDFPLPEWREEAAEITRILEHGIGFVLLRGMPIGGLTLEEAEKIYWGLSLTIGTPISQNKAGELMGHVRDEGFEYGRPNQRGYNTRAKLLFHTDNSDVVALLCLQTAKSGGASSICSAMAIHDEIARRDPELLEILCRGFHYDLRGEERPGVWQVTPHRIPVFSRFAGRTSVRYVRNAIRLATVRTGVPLTDRETAALDLFDELAHSPEFRLDMEFRPGDVQLLNNHVLVHARTEFEDWPEPERKRHLLRLWLNLYEGRPLAEDFANRYGPGGGRLGVPPAV